MFDLCWLTDTEWVPQQRNDSMSQIHIRSLCEAPANCLPSPGSWHSHDVGLAGDGNLLLNYSTSCDPHHVISRCMIGHIFFIFGQFA